MAGSAPETPAKIEAPRGAGAENGEGLRQNPAAIVGVKVRLHTDTIERAKYWGPRHGESYNEYIAVAVEQRIARENGDYDLPLLEQQRLNQMLDQLKGLTSTVDNLQLIVNAGFSSVLGLARGDSYLTDAKDGELPSGAPASGVLFAGSGFDSAFEALGAETDEGEDAA